MADLTLDQVERAITRVWGTGVLRPSIVHITENRAVRSARAWYSMLPHRASYWRYLKKRGAR